MTRERRLARLLVVAGKDPTGGAGVDADCEAAEAFGAEARCVVSADTDQDGVRVKAVRPRDPQVWTVEAYKELTLVERPRALKSGLLPGAAHVRAFAALVGVARVRDPELPAVVDPLLAASGGEVFLDDEGRRALLDELLPLGVVLTPNLGEAARLSETDPLAIACDPEARREVARILLERGARAVLLKGGHGTEDPVQDLCWERGENPRWHEHARIPGRGMHGSGCRYATAVAALLARGYPVHLAFREAGEWLARRIAEGPERPAG